MRTRVQDIYSIAQVKGILRNGGIFYTPTELSSLLRQWLPEGFRPRRVYDPTCGRGSLLKPYEGEGVELYGVDIEPHAVEHCRETLEGFTGYACDVLHDAPTDKYDLIVGNFPFSVRWSGKNTDPMVEALGVPCYPTATRADYMFVLHSLSRLKEGGIYYTIIPIGFLYREGREGKLRQWLVDSGYIRRIVRLGEDKFTDTEIETAIVFFSNSGKVEDIYFNDLETGREVAVPIDEIRDNRYNLMPKLYNREESEGQRAIPTPDTAEVVNVGTEHIRATIGLLKACDLLTGKTDAQSFKRKVIDIMSEEGEQ